MLSVEETKRLIGDENLSDVEASEIRDAFRILGEIIFEQWLMQSKNRESNEDEYARKVQCKTN